MPRHSPEPEEEKGLTARLAQGGKRGAKESLRAAGSPVLGYFDRRFADLQLHFEQRFAEMSAHVATEVETISELTLGMQRLVDLSAEQVERLVKTVEGFGGPPAGDGPATAPHPSVAAFTLAASTHVPAGAPVLVGGANRNWLAAALRSLGYQVTTAGAGLRGPNAVAADTTEWAGRFAGVFWDASDGDGVDGIDAWLAPGGQFVTAVPEGAAPALAEAWDIVDTASGATPGVALIRAVPRRERARALKTPG